MLHQVGIFHGTEADKAGDLLLLGLRKIGVLLYNDREGTLHRLVKQSPQFDILAGAGLHHLAVLP